MIEVEVPLTSAVQKIRQWDMAHVLMAKLKLSSWVLPALKFNIRHTSNPQCIQVWSVRIGRKPTLTSHNSLSQPRLASERQFSDSSGYFQSIVQLKYIIGFVPSMLSASLDALKWGKAANTNCHLLRPYTCRFQAAPPTRPGMLLDSMFVWHMEATAKRCQLSSYVLTVCWSKIALHTKP